MRGSYRSNDVLHLGPTGGTTGLSQLVPTTRKAQLLETYRFTRAFTIIEDAHTGPELITAATGKLPGFFGAVCRSTEGARTRPDPAIPGESRYKNQWQKTGPL